MSNASSVELAVRAVIGTAGHVDHGKTTLVKHLTGIDTDRLREEKQRGISIELGFAWLDLAPGRVAIIDVPGHERFVRQMIAGAAGIDLVLLVVAADEGVMPQTREHLDICGLLGVRAGAVVLTKTDLVDDEWLELVREDLADEVRGTFLEGAPVVGYAAGDEGLLAEVRAQVGALIEDAASRGLLAARSADRPLKMSVDRVFTMRGFGTVATGTTGSGQLSVGASVRVQPSGSEARVRGIQVHGAACQRVGPGVRAAINLQGVERDAVHRGEVLTTRKAGLPATSMFDARFTALRRLAEPVPDRSRVLFHIGTNQVQGTLAFVGAEAVAPGDTVLAQCRLDHPACVLPGEPLVVRGFATLQDYGKTIGGGRVLTWDVRRHRRDGQDALDLADALLSEDPARAVAGFVRYHAELGRTPEELDIALAFDRSRLRGLCTELEAVGLLFEAGGRWWHAATLTPLLVRVEAVLAEAHASRPARPGLLPEELRTRVRGDLAADLFGLALEQLLERGAVVRAGEYAALAGFQPRRSASQQAACEAVANVLEAGGLSPTRVQDLPEAAELSADAVAEVLELLWADGSVVRVSQELSFAAAALGDLEARLRAHLEAHETIDTTSFKELTGASRKWTIPLQEYFDRIRVTLRVGDVRRLRG